MLEKGQERGDLFAIGTLSLALFSMPGCCHDSGGSQMVGTTATPEVKMVDFSTVPIQDNPIIELNRWLAANPDRRVSDIAGVLAYREGCREFVIHHEAGNNARQVFKQLDKDTRNLQSYVTSHPGERIVAMTTVPSYSGGIREWIICTEKNAADSSDLPRP